MNHFCSSKLKFRAEDIIFMYKRKAEDIIFVYKHFSFHEKFRSQYSTELSELVSRVYFRQSSSSENSELHPSSELTEGDGDLLAAAKRM